MAVTRTQLSIQATADADAATGPFYCKSVRFVGTGLTPGQRLLVLSRASGPVLFDFYTTTSEENQEFLVECQWIEGFHIEEAPTGTWRLQIQLG